jgi:hypothetical protein
MATPRALRTLTRMAMPGSTEGGLLGEGGGDGGRGHASGNKRTVGCIVLDVKVTTPLFSTV